MSTQILINKNQKKFQKWLVDGFFAPFVITESVSLTSLIFEDIDPENPVVDQIVADLAKFGLKKVSINSYL